MPDTYGIKDLPDAGSLVDSKRYLPTGKHLNVITSILNQLWRGENVNAGPNIRVRQFGLGGVSISAANQDGSGGGGAHAYTVQDASTGTTPKITVTPGTHNGITPTIYGTPINTKTGMPPVYPALTLGSSDTMVYFQIDYNASNVVTSVEISSGTSLPSSTIVSGVAGSDYKLLSTVVITYAPMTGKASVLCNNDAVSGPQQYYQCLGTSYSVLA